MLSSVSAWNAQIQEPTPQMTDQKYASCFFPWYFRYFLLTFSKRELAHAGFLTLHHRLLQNEKFNIFLNYCATELKTSLKNTLNDSGFEKVSLIVN